MLLCFSIQLAIKHPQSLRRAGDGARGKMLQCGRMILEGRETVCLRQMTGIAGFREQGEVRQFQVLDHPGYAVDGRAIGLPLHIGMREHQAKKEDKDAQQRQAKA